MDINVTKNLLAYYEAADECGISRADLVSRAYTKGANTPNSFSIILQSNPKRGVCLEWTFNYGLPFNYGSEDKVEKNAIEKVGQGASIPLVGAMLLDPLSCFNPVLVPQYHLRFGEPINSGDLSYKSYNKTRALISIAPKSNIGTIQNQDTDECRRLLKVYADLAVSPEPLIKEMVRIYKDF